LVELGSAKNHFGTKKGAALIGKGNYRFPISVAFFFFFLFGGGGASNF